MGVGVCGCGWVSPCPRVSPSPGVGGDGAHVRLHQPHGAARGAGALARAPAGGAAAAAPADHLRDQPALPGRAWGGTRGGTRGGGRTELGEVGEGERGRLQIVYEVNRRLQDVRGGSRVGGHAWGTHVGGHECGATSGGGTERREAGEGGAREAPDHLQGQLALVGHGMVSWVGGHGWGGHEWGDTGRGSQGGSRVGRAATARLRDELALAGHAGAGTHEWGS